MQIRDILECCLYAENLQETADWYAETLGLVRFSESPDRHVFFRAGGRCFFLFNPRATQDESTTAVPVPPHGAVGPGHVCFAIADDELNGWRTLLQEKGVPIEREIDWPNGATSLYVRDPAGNSVELASPALWQINEAECFPRKAAE